MKQLQNLKEVFINHLEKATLVYKTGGMSDRESPMWFQLNTLENYNDDCLLFKSSQSDVWMCIPCTKEQKKFVDFHYQEAYDYFKRLKYIYLRDNHPTLWYELGELCVNRLETYLKTGERFFGGKPVHLYNEPVVKQSSLRKNILLVLAIVMFVLTTSLIVLIPKALVYKLDAIQWIVLAIIMFMGYAGGALYLMAYLTPEDELIGKKQEKHKNY
jgi:hypothetical protein